MARKKEHEKEPNHERWLLTYSDLITLLMIFFIVMYSMSSVDQSKYKQLAQGLNKAMGGGGGASIIGTDSGAISLDKEWKPSETSIVSEETSMEDAKGQLEKYVKENGLSESVGISIENRGLVVSFKDSLFFDLGKAAVKPQYTDTLLQVAKTLNLPGIQGNYVRVEGHTDNQPMKNWEFQSNWELSTKRATNVLQLLISQGGVAPQRIEAVGLGEYRNIASNDTPQGQAQNRRVDIIILNSKFNAIEQTSK